MKHLVLSILTVFFTITTKYANAEIWRVNNNATGTYGENLGGNVSKPVFASMAAVMSSSLIPASSGDTIYLEGSNSNYGSFTINKQITLIGAGYLLNQNDSSSWNNLISFGDNITINANNVRIIGIALTNNIVFSTPSFTSITINNFTVSRCRFNSFYYTGNSGTGATINNLVTDRCMLLGQNVFTTSPGEFIALNTNAIISNNIILGALNNTFYNIVNNNVFNSTQTLTFSCNEFKNNIIRQAAQTTSITCALNAFTNNIAPTAAQFPAGYNSTNLVITESQQINTVFVNTATNSDDGDYQLRPAYKVGTVTPTNLGADSTERGVYGGAYPYTKSGIGPIPVIYKVNTSGVANQTGLNISISTKAVK